MAKRTKDLETGLAKVLFAIAKQGGQIARAQSDIEAVLAFAEKNLKLKEFLRSSVAPQSAKEEVLGKIFGNIISPSTLLFLGKVVEHEMFGKLRSILRLYMDEVSNVENVAFAEVTSAVELDSGALGRVVSETARVTGKSIEVRSKVDPAILGGVIVRVEGKVIDLSLGQRLQDLRSKLTATV